MAGRSFWTTKGHTVIKYAKKVWGIGKKVHDYLRNRDMAERRLAMEEQNAEVDRERTRAATRRDNIAAVGDVIEVAKDLRDLNLGIDDAFSMLRGLLGDDALALSRDEQVNVARPMDQTVDVPPMSASTSVLPPDVERDRGSGELPTAQTIAPGGIDSTSEVGSPGVHVEQPEPAQAALEGLAGTVDASPSVTGQLEKRGDADPPAGLGADGGTVVTQTESPALNLTPHPATVEYTGSSEEETASPDVSDSSTGGFTLPVPTMQGEGHVEKPSGAGSLDPALLRKRRLLASASPRPDPPDPA